MGGSFDGAKEQRRRIGRWNESVELHTSSRKNRYCSMRGCACNSAALVCASCGGSALPFEAWVEVVEDDGRCGDVRGRLSFSMRAHVR